MAQKKLPTTKDKLKSATRKKNVLFSGELISVITPYVAVGIANYDEYFVQYNGTKVSIGFILAMAVMGFTVIAISKQKLKPSILTILIPSIVINIVFFLIGQVINDIAYIMLFGNIGLASCFVCDEERKKQVAQIEKLKKGIEQAELDTIAEEHKKELNK